MELVIMNGPSPRKRKPLALSPQEAAAKMAAKKSALREKIYAGVLIIASLGISIPCIMWMEGCKEQAKNEEAKKEERRQSEKAKATDGSMTVLESCWGFLTLEDYDRAGVLKNDQKAFDQFLLGLSMSKRANIFKAGERVFLEEYAFLHGAVKLRKEGEVGGFWVPQQIIQKSTGN